MNERINAAISEVIAVQDAPNPETASPDVTETTDAVVEEPKTEDEVVKDPIVEENKLNFPKPAQNAIARQKHINGRLRAENEAFKTQLAELQETVKKLQPQTADPNAPKEEQFDNYGEYLKASIKYDLAKDAPPAPKQVTPEQLQQYTALQERVKAVEAQEVEFLKIAPDYKEVEAEYQDLIDLAPQELVNLFLEVENPPQAFYTLAKQGKLESLLDMPLHKAAIEIGKAMAVGIPQPKKISSAPAPLKPINGSGSGSKPLENQSYKEIRDWLNS
jgi:hypothetical protein